jgi:sulfur carrier protein ThiS
MMAAFAVRGFGKLHRLFSERSWSNPHHYETEGSLTAAELMNKLDLPVDDVEVVFINRLIKPLSTPLQDGDRVSFVPPGVPSIHRFNLGFYDVKETRK